MINVRKMGSIKAQRRACDRILKLMSGLCVDLQLIPAKRGRFSLVLVSWSMWDPNIGATLEDGAPPPANTGIAIVLNEYTGANHIPQSRVGIPLVVTGHAIVRLAMRAGVRNIGDLIRSLRALWEAVSALLEDKSVEEWLEPPEGAWRLPLRGDDADSPIVVLERDRDGAERLVVVTVLPPN